MAKFNSGEVVILKSGGPKMTVSKNKRDINGNTTTKVFCDWFDGAKPNQELFEEDQLELDE